jgi:hypothetical protein
MLLAAPYLGKLYEWDPTTTPQPRATAVTGSPPGAMRGFFVTPERFVICYGASQDTGTTIDPLNIWWCHQGDYNVWTPASTNTANKRRLTQGKKIMGGTELGQGLSLIWTDTAAYAHQYTGSRFVFDTRLIGTHCGLYGPQAFCVAMGRAYWIGSSAFHVYAGTVGQITNSEDISEWVFAKLRQYYETKTVCYFNQRYKEVWWYIVPEGSTEPGVYVAVNLNDYSWISGEMTRTAALRDDPISGDTRPILAGNDGNLYTHEVGVDDNGEVQDSWITTAPLALDESAQDMEVLGFIPDFSKHVKEITIEVTAEDRAGAGEIDRNTETVQQGFGIVDLRLAGREVSFTIRSKVLGGDFRLGAPKFEVTGGGKRR